jgi:predicted amidophosphoribosyltransferase
MALQTCPDCSKEVSSQAASCPTCGAPFATHSTGRVWRNVALALFVVLPLLALIGELIGLW